MNIVDQIVRSEDPIDRTKSSARRNQRSAAEKNPEATWTDRDQPWFFPTTNAGPVYGRPRSGRRLTRAKGGQSNNALPGGNFVSHYSVFGTLTPPRKSYSIPYKNDQMKDLATLWNSFGVGRGSMGE